MRQIDCIHCNWFSVFLKISTRLQTPLSLLFDWSKSLDLLTGKERGIQRLSCWPLFTSPVPGAITDCERSLRPAPQSVRGRAIKTRHLWAVTRFYPLNQPYFCQELASSVSRNPSPTGGDPLPAWLSILDARNCKAFAEIPNNCVWCESWYLANNPCTKAAVFVLQHKKVIILHLRYLNFIGK